MKVVPLTKGYSAYIDDDCSWVMDYRWHAMEIKTKNHSYAYAGRNMPRDKDGKRQLVLMHREIAGARPDQCVDHINGDTTDNRRENLRVCSHKDNMKSRRMRGDFESKYKGVRKSHGSNRWCARVRSNGEYFHLGTFDTELEAAKAYDAFVDEHHGEFAVKNL